MKNNMSDKEVINLGDLIVIIDTLLGSCSITDTAGLWKYTPGSRRNLADKLLRISEGIELKNSMEDK
jgi:hypothetical protein